MKQPIAAFLDLQPEVQQQANPYWWIRVALTPLVLLNMTISGILQVYIVHSVQMAVHCVSMHHATSQMMYPSVHEHLWYSVSS